MNEQGTDTDRSDADAAPIHERPRRPLRPAPACRGMAGVSSGTRSLIRRDISTRTSRRRPSGPEKLARALGWAGLAIGIAETLFPHDIADALGLDFDPEYVRVRGATGIAAGAALLACSRPQHAARALQARAVADVVDIAAVAANITPGNRRVPAAAAATGALVGVFLIDAFAAAMLNPR